VVRCSPQRHHADHERAAALHHAPAPGERAVPGVEHVAQRAAERDDRVKRLLVEAAEVADVELPPVLDARREPAGLADLAVARELRGGQIADDDAAAEPVQDLGEPSGAAPISSTRQPRGTNRSTASVCSTSETRSPRLRSHRSHSAWPSRS